MPVKSNKVDIASSIVLLHNVGLGQNLTDDELTLIARIMEPHVFQPEEAIFEEDSLARDVYLLEHGKVSIRIKHPSTPDKEEVLHNLHDGEIFGELALVDGSPRSATVRVEDEARIHVFPYEAIMDLMDLNPLLGYKLMRNIARIIANRVRNTNMMWRCTLIW
ncbi:cyclic nucleotide-binding domain-containing protein [Calditrichota bacterium]